MSVIAEDNQNQHLLICKGAVEEIMRLSPRVEVEGQVLDAEPAHDAHRKQLGQKLNEQGFRVVAVAYKTIPGDEDEPCYTVEL
jgi:Mg2+-importing ATPase